ncbi:MAG: glycosyltransferase [Bacteroidetes bacterium]|nr:glycosyltransferase [Bacteroidota bacterium]
MTTDLILCPALTELRFQDTSIERCYTQQEGMPELIPSLPMVLFITSFPPRECGIATYSQDLINALNRQFENTYKYAICALESDTEQHVYGEQPKFILNTDQRNAFAKTAFKINRDSNIKLVVMQHEFGFFALKEDEYKFMFSKISKPIVFVFHTVLPSPDNALRSKVQDMAEMASSIIVMTANAAKILTQEYNISNLKIIIIPHGTHLVPPLDRKKVKMHYQLLGRKVLSTFGLLGSSKSIETTLDALPAVIADHPEVLFLVLGKTHPSLVKQDGERYRVMLEEKVKALNLEQHVRFVNEYLPLPILLEYLQLSDIYLFTSKDPNQAVSGTFSYAISCGCPVISTPIPHAKEVLGNNNGLIIDFENSIQLSKAIISLLDDDQLRSEISSNSFQRMASTAWQNSAIAHMILFEELTNKAFTLKYKVPEINLKHIGKMTTDFGMIQFAKISIPDITSGYTLDDNARALIALCQNYELDHSINDLALINTYLAFIYHSMQPDGKFLNYFDDQKKFTSQNFMENLEDSQGRAIWALGYLISLHDILPLKIVREAKRLFSNALPHLKYIYSTRAMAFIIKGLHYQDDIDNRELLETFANRLVQMYRHEKTNEWCWFEDSLTYGNSLLSEALLCAYLTTNNEQYQFIAKESFCFLLSKIFVDNKIKVISNKGWLLKDKNATNVIGGEQPIDVAYAILALEKFYFVFNNNHYKQKAIIAFNWFMGDNHLHQIVYNPCTGGCYDGVEENNVNLNQGAESTLSYLLARLSIERLITTELQLHAFKQKRVQLN